MKHFFLRSVPAHAEPMFSMGCLILALSTLLTAGCAPNLPANSARPISAIYLVQGSGQLTETDLRAHPEVAVASSFDEFRKLARSKLALWVDINAASLVDGNWLSKKPQSFYPIALVGDGDWPCSFRSRLIYFTFEEPPFKCDPAPKGFSVNIQTSETGGWGQGYNETPTVGRILQITDGLREGRLPNDNGSPTP